MNVVSRLRSRTSGRLVKLAAGTIALYSVTVFTANQVIGNDHGKNLEPPDFAVGLSTILTSILVTAAAQSPPSATGGGSDDGGPRLAPASRLYAVLTAMLLCTGCAVLLWVAAEGDAFSAEQAPLPGWVQLVVLLMAAIGAASAWVFLAEGHRLYTHAGPGIHRALSTVVVGAAGYLVLTHLIEERLSVDDWHDADDWSAVEYGSSVSEATAVSERVGAVVVVLALVFVLWMVRTGRRPAAVQWVQRYLDGTLPTRVPGQGHGSPPPRWWERVLVVGALSFDLAVLSGPMLVCTGWVFWMMASGRILAVLVTVVLYTAAGWAVVELGLLLTRSGHALTRWLVPLVAWLAALVAVSVAATSTVMYVAVAKASPSDPPAWLLGTWHITRVYYQPREDGGRQPAWYLPSGPQAMQLEFRDNGTALLIAAAGWATYRAAVASGQVQPVPAASGPAMLPDQVVIGSLPLPSMDTLLDYVTFGGDRIKLAIPGERRVEDREPREDEKRDEAQDTVMTFFCRPDRVVLLADIRLELTTAEGAQTSLEQPSGCPGG